ncbi:MAG: hypothetical protein LBG82_05200 [Clostridiales Family XIII bacterium]|jgi:uncharacterized membrane protein|nr:hypothetical protein [Clostridiales Family XIII bacterium]
MDKNAAMVVSLLIPLAFIIASKWLVPMLEKKFKEKAKTVYLVVSFVVVIIGWYLIDTHYGIHMGLW